MNLYDLRYPGIQACPEIVCFSPLDNFVFCRIRRQRTKLSSGLKHTIFSRSSGIRAFIVCPCLQLHKQVFHPFAGQLRHGGDLIAKFFERAE